MLEPLPRPYMHWKLYQKMFCHPHVHFVRNTICIFFLLAIWQSSLVHIFVQYIVSLISRTFKPWYQKKTSYKGIKTNRYIANIGDFANDPQLQCFCEQPDKCPPKGLMDLSKCIGVPMYVSMPHFYDSDPELVKNIKGLSPDVNEHEIAIDFEPVSIANVIIFFRCWRQ